jgi:hypothetical protein
MAKRKNNAAIYDVDTLLQAGIDPKTGLPLKMDTGLKSWRKDAIKASLRIMDEQNAVNRYRWFNQYAKLSSQELERLLYYKGNLCLFYMEALDEFFIMPYALDGTIDFYGRFNTVHPVPFAGGATEDERAEIGRQQEVLSTLKLKVYYEVPEEPLTYEERINACVLLHDYTKQMSQTIIPRQQIQDPILDIMADCIPFMRTALLSGTGIQGMRVNSQDEYSNVKAASQAVDKAALTGQKWVPVIGNIDFQDMTGGDVAKAEEYLLAMQGLDNYRLSLYGLSQGGLFQKKAHMLEAEQDMNAGNVGLILDDGLAIRQHFCDVANAIWGGGMSCEIAEPAAGIDNNMDGIISTETDQSGQYEGDQDEQAAQGG